jgi:hypothetical protein
MAWCRERGGGIASRHWYSRVSLKIKYEAQDPRVGGHFIIWVQREKIWYGLDSKLYPAAKSVEVTDVTPAPGSTTITMIAVTSVNSGVPDYFHLSGNVRFKISGTAVNVLHSTLPSCQRLSSSGLAKEHRNPSR